jgi:MFS transporter, DHA3 family, macrolide efflux protein
MRDRDYWKLVIGSFLSAFGSSMYFVAVAWILTEMTNDVGYTGLMVGLGFVPGVVLNPLFGVWVDRANRKRLAVQAQSAVTLTMVLLLAVMLAGSLHPWMILVVHMLVQTFASLYRTAQQAYITEVYEKTDIPRMYSDTGSAVSTGQLLGASLGGLAVSALSNAAVLSVVAVVFLLSVFTMTTLKRAVLAPAVTSKEPTSVVQDLVDSWFYLKRNPLMYSLFSLMFVGQLVIHTSMGLLPAYTSAYLGGTSRLYGFLESATSVGAILAGITATWFLLQSRRNVSTMALLAVAAGLALMAFSHNVVFAFVAIFMVGVGTTWLRTLMQSVQQVSTEPAYYGRMAAYRQMINQTSVAIGGPILGWIAGRVGVQYSYAALMVPIAICLLLSLRVARKQSFVAAVQSMIAN